MIDNEYVVYKNFKNKNSYSNRRWYT